MWRFGVLVTIVGCSERVDVAGPTWDDDGTLPVTVAADTAAEAPDYGACGPTHLVDLRIVGVAIGSDAAPLAGAVARLETRDWGPVTVHGAGTTVDDGSFDFLALDVPIVEGCWAIGPQFYVVVEEGALYGEDGANPEVVRAWLDGTYVADLSDPPVVAAQR
ncbi:MAG: hypothetical protein R3F59_03160 [Myxococcota bacterium]